MKKMNPVTCGATWASILQPELNAISTAMNNYISDQSVANCNALKNSYQAYITKLKPYGNCAALTAGEKTQFNQALKEFEDDLPTLCD
ncbi:MAG: hypothetical protein U5K79_19085 [Cyclobacteriaceae bacterium]|nr:hypothetical protein [Cyclobacteriaceae bacterium]